jgi:hypothetical protein
LSLTKLCLKIHTFTLCGQVLKEKISKNDIENCKKGMGVMELFILYRFFEREYPKKAKGYWRFCGF